MIRTLHCSTNAENYNLCLSNQVAGFTHRGPQSGDVIYLLYKEGKKSMCGARFILDSVTDEKPWEDADNYVLCYSVKEIEYCNFFDMSFLGEIGGSYWALKYLQSSKAFDDKAAKELDKVFLQNKVTERTYPVEKQEETESEEDEEISDSERKKIEKDVPDAEIKIMGTFQTVNFRNETDPFRGLEKLVSDNFFKLFPDKYREENTILISDNRLFKTQQKKENIVGESRIPDALMITFDKHRTDIPLRISLVEYECYGENKAKTPEKSKYMNQHIIPQLMQFASSFSTITDEKTRDNTINDWIEKIEAQDNLDMDKIKNWMHQINPNIKDEFIISTFEKELRKAFNGNIHVYLIIDELSSEQKETIKNIIASFKLLNGQSVIFDSSIVRLVQKINFIDSNFEYGLTAQ